MEHGYYTNPAKGLTLSVPPNTWTTIAHPVDLAPGPSVFNVQVYATLPSTRPKDIRVRLLRNGNDPTSQQSLVVGTLTAWSAVYTTIDYIDLTTDYTIEVWHNGSGAMVFNTVIVKVLTPAEYIAARIAK